MPVKESRECKSTEDAITNSSPSWTAASAAAASTMPFKIKLKKNKQQYNVASKSMFVLTVELLDSAMLECTLTADSTGKVYMLSSACSAG